MKQNIQLIILVALVAVLGLVAHKVLRKPRPGGAPVAARSAQVKPLPESDDLARLAGWFTAGAPSASEAAHPQKGFGLPPPPVEEPPVAASVQGGQRKPSIPLTLQGILMRGGAPRALIGNRAYGINDRVAQSHYRVRSIESSSVVLVSNEGTELVLDLLQ